MTFAERLINFFETLFFGSSSEYKVKRELRRIETELRTSPPVLKSGMLQPLFAQALFVLYRHSQEIKTILDETLFSDIASKKARCIELLMFAAFSEQVKEQFESLSYEKKKKAAIANAQALENQHAVFEKILQEIQSQKPFKQVQALLYTFERCKDLCGYDYGAYLKLFDRSFTETSDYVPSFTESALTSCENLIMDLYFLTAEFKLTNSTAGALFMLKQMVNQHVSAEQAREDLLPRLKQIAGVFTRVLSADTLTNLLRVAKKDVSFTPQVAKYETPYIENYCRWLRTAFDAEKAQIEMEIQNEQIAEDLRVLFAGRDIVSLIGYNKETNEQLHLNSHTPFLWVLPMQILKSFLTYYLTSSQENLLDSLVVEGFFIDQMYQSNFAAVLFSCKEVRERIARFEAAFTRNGAAAPGILSGLINGAKRNLEDGRQLELLITKYNGEAKKIMEDSVHQIASLARLAGEILNDFKRSKSEIVSNLKMLFLSARNKESVETLDRQYSMWLKFIDIMGNYVIIKKSEQPPR